MTVDQLIEKLAALPGDWEVIMKDEVGDYREWEPVNDIEVGEWGQKDNNIFHTFKSRDEEFCDPNAVLLKLPK